MGRARQTIKIRVKRTGSGNGSFKPCGTCGGTGIVAGGTSKPTRTRRR